MARDAGPQLRFVLNGFSPDKGFRLFKFQRLETLEGVQTRRDFTVRTDLSLIRGYGIHVQELPLLCRELLERRADSEAAQHLTYTEEDMRLHQADRIAAQQTPRKMSARKPPIENAGRTWRTPGLLRTESRVPQS